MSLSYIGDTYSYAERQSAIGRFIGAVALGQILGFSLGGVVADVLSWRAIFLIYGVVSLGVFGCFWRRTRGLPNRERDGGSLWRAALASYRGLFAHGPSRAVLVAVFVDGFFFYGGFAYVGAYLRDRFGLLYLVIGLILLGGMVVGLGYLALALLSAWPLSIPLIVTMGLGYYMIHSTLQTRATELAPKARGTAVSLFAFSFFLGQGAGAAAIGQIVDGAGYLPAFLAAGAGMVALGVAYAWLATRRQPATWRS
jgi:predicted MFS family arabinose efflux permease